MAMKFKRVFGQGDRVMVTNKGKKTRAVITSVDAHGVWVSGCFHPFVEGKCKDMTIEFDQDWEYLQEELENGYLDHTDN